MQGYERIVFCLFIALISAVVAGLVAIVVCYFNNSQSISKIYKELIAAERIKWLNSLRECMADYLAKSYYILGLRDQPAQQKDVLMKNKLSAEITQLAFLIKLRLNPHDRNHKTLAESLTGLDELTHRLLDNGENGEAMFALYERKIAELSFICQEVLKEAWENIKLEAKPKEADASKEESQDGFVGELIGELGKEAG